MENGTTRYLPGVRPVQRLEFVELEKLVIDEGGEPASDRLKRSIQALGVEQSLLVQDRDDGTYYVVAGRRRTLVARAVGLERVACIIYPSSMSRQEILAARLVENEHRGRNPLGEYEAVKALLEPLVAEGHADPLGAVCAELRLRRPRLEELLKLDRLEPELLELWKARRMRFSTAVRASSLGPERQRELVEAIGQDGKLTDQMVQEVTRARRAEGLTGLMPSLGIDPNLREGVVRAPVPVQTGEEVAFELTMQSQEESEAARAGGLNINELAELMALVRAQLNIVPTQPVTDEDIRIFRAAFQEAPAGEPYVLDVPQDRFKLAVEEVQAIVAAPGSGYADLSEKLDLIAAVVRMATEVGAPE